MKKTKKISKREETRRIIITIIGSTIFSIGVGWILSPANLYASGLTGILQLLVDFLKSKGMNFNLGIIVLIANIPLLLLANRHLSRKFFVYTFISLVIQTLILTFPSPLPDDLFGIDMLTRTILGAAVLGLGGGICLRVGASGGGTDIIFQLLSLKRGLNFDKLNLYINGLIIVLAVVVNHPSITGSSTMTHDFAMAIGIYTTIRLVLTVVVISVTNNSYELLKLNIFTKESDIIIRRIQEEVGRGVTIFDAKGGYSKSDITMIYVLINRYELKACRKIVVEEDKKALISISKTEKVFGNFTKKVI